MLNDVQNEPRKCLSLIFYPVIVALGFSTIPAHTRQGQRRVRECEKEERTGKKPTNRSSEIGSTFSSNLGCLRRGGG